MKKFCQPKPTKIKICIWEFFKKSTKKEIDLAPSFLDKVLPLSTFGGIICGLSSKVQHQDKSSCKYGKKLMFLCHHYKKDLLGLSHKE